MARASATIFLATLALAGGAGLAIGQERPAQALSAAQPHAAMTPAPAETGKGFSAECLVPGVKLFTMAPLKGIAAALKQQRPLKVLAVGSSSTLGIGASSPLASYPARLEDELEKDIPGKDIEVMNRGVAGEVALAAGERIQNLVAEIEPDLVVWQVGTNDALARVDVEAFASSLSETIAWLQSHKIDVVLVDPQYAASLAGNEHYSQIVAAIGKVAETRKVPLVRRYEAMRYLAHNDKGAYLTRDSFHLNDLGYRCMAEHVARAITVSLLHSGSDRTKPVLGE